MYGSLAKGKVGTAVKAKGIAAFLAVTLAVLAAGCSDDTVSDLVSRAEFAERSGDYRAAAVYYGTAASRSPRDEFVRWELAKVLLTVRDGASAEKEIRVASELGVDDERTRPALAQALFLQGKHREVIELPVDGLGKMAAAMVLAYQARAYLELDQIESADSVLRRAVKLTRYSADVLFAQAELALLRKDHQEALEALRNVDLLERDFPYAAAKHGEIALARGDAASAERYYSEAVEQRFGSWRDLLNRGVARLRQGKIEQALQDAGELLASSPEHADTHFFAYQVYALKGDPGRARIALEQALERDPDDFRVLYALARIEVAEGNHDRGESLVRSAHARQPAFVPARKLLAVLLLEQDRANEALGMILPALEASAADSELIRIIAYGYLRAGRYDELIGLADRLQGQISEGRREALEQGIMQLRAGESDAARGMIGRAVAISVRDLRAVNPLEISLAPGPDPSGSHQPAETDDPPRHAQPDLRHGPEGRDTAEPAAPVQIATQQQETQSAEPGGLAADSQAPTPAVDPNAQIETPGAASAMDEPVSEPASGEPRSQEESAAPAAPAQSVEDFVRDWAGAWSRQDVDGYLSLYAAGFQPGDGVSREAWAEQRRQRLMRPKSIKVQISALEVVPLDEQHVRVTFEQAYRADHYQDRVNKTLYLQLRGRDWRILRELSD